MSYCQTCQTYYSAIHSCVPVDYSKKTESMDRKRKIVQMCATKGTLYLLCSDGSLWIKTSIGSFAESRYAKISTEQIEND